MTIVSFGYRYLAACRDSADPATSTCPLDACLVLDARCLHEDPAEHLTLATSRGTDAICVDYLGSLPDVQRFATAALGAARMLAADYRDVASDALTIAIGCHSGRHRSVYLAETLACELRAFGESVTVRHLDVDRPRPIDMPIALTA